MEGWVDTMGLWDSGADGHPQTSHVTLVVTVSPSPVYRAVMIAIVALSSHLCGWYEFDDDHSTSQKNSALPPKRNKPKKDEPSILR